MRTKGIVLSLATAMCLAACNGGNSQSEDSWHRVVEDVDEATGIITQRDYEISDTIIIKGRTYRYTYALAHADSMGVVINPEGLEYRESYVKVKVECGDKVVFDRTYFKNDFTEFVPSADLPQYTMVGVNYNFDKSDDRSALFFIVTVGDPDETSDTAYPLELRVGTDGAASFSRARNLDTGSLNPNLNVDPSGNEGV